ncbi:hypothetical protein Tco_0741000 [Tanacetum coccineum]
MDMESKASRVVEVNAAKLMIVTITSWFPIDFIAFAMNRLQINNLTKADLVGPNNHKGDRCPYDLTKPLLVQMSSQGRQIVPLDLFFNNNLKYLRGGSDDKKYTASTTKSKAARTVIQARVEDLQLGVESYQKKLNLTKPRTRDVDMFHRPAYTTLSNPKDAFKFPLGVQQRYGEGDLDRIGPITDSHHDQRHQSNADGETDHEELGKVCWWKGIQGRPQTASKDNMTLSYIVLLF